MTDRAKALLVHLDDDYRIGDFDTGADRLIDAIEMIRGVVKVEPLVANGIDDRLARERVRRELTDQLWSVLNEDPS